MLVCEESRRSRSSDTSALIVRSSSGQNAPDPTAPPAASSPSSTISRNGRHNNRRRNTRPNRVGQQHQQAGSYTQPRPPMHTPWSTSYSYYWPSPWVPPPCPYPTTAGRGILGPSPRAPSSAAQAYATPSMETSNQFTELPQAFSTMSSQHPDDSWYMDTRASSHMTAHTGNLHTVFNTSTTSHVLVGNGSHIPVQGSGIANLTPNLSLTNVLLTPHIVKNLVSVRKFTHDNNVSVEFDPFGFL